MTGRTSRATDSSVNRRRRPGGKAAPTVARAAIQRRYRNVVRNHVFAAPGSKGSRRAAAMATGTSARWGDSVSARRPQEGGEATGVAGGMAGIARSRGRNMVGGFGFYACVGRTCVMAGRTSCPADEGVACRSHRQSRCRETSGTGVGGGVT